MQNKTKIIYNVANTGKALPKEETELAHCRATHCLRVALKKAHRDPQAQA